MKSTEKPILRCTIGLFEDGNVTVLFVNTGILSEKRTFRPQAAHIVIRGEGKSKLEYHMTDGKVTCNRVEPGRGLTGRQRKTAGEPDPNSSKPITEKYIIGWSEDKKLGFYFVVGENTPEGLKGLLDSSKMGKYYQDSRAALEQAWKALKELVGTVADSEVKVVRMELRFTKDNKLV
jgi:hypothetical protein